MQILITRNADNNNEIAIPYAQMATVCADPNDTTMAFVNTGGKTYHVTSPYAGIVETLSTYRLEVTVT